MALDCGHEAFRAEEVRIQVALLRQPRRQLFLAQQAHGVACRAHAIVLVIAVEALELRMLGRQGVDPFPKGMHPAVTRAVDKMHRALGGQGRFEHRQCWRDAHPAADQHQRFIAGGQGELARWREQVDRRADLQLIMQVVGHPPTGFTLDADAVLAGIAEGRQGIVAAHFFAIEQQRHTNVLTGLGGEDRAVVQRGEIEGRDFGTFLHALDQLERPRTPPAARRLGFLVIDRSFGADQDVRQLTVGRAPGAHHLGSGNLAAQHFGNRTQQAGPHDRVMFRQDLQGHVFVDDLRHQITQLIQLVDMSCIHQHTIGQGTGLVAADLVRLVEQRAHLRVLGEHHAVEMGDQRFAAAFQQGHGGFDDGTVLGTKHGASWASLLITLEYSVFMPTNKLFYFNQLNYL